MKDALKKYGLYQDRAVYYSKAETAPIVMCTVLVGNELLLVKRGYGLADVEVTVFHRTFAKMTEQILSSGFNIERVVEPQPSEGMRAIDPDTYQQLTKIPTFMIWALRK